MAGVPIVLVGPVSDNYGMPSLAVSILKTSLKERGIPSKVVYANMLFYETAGLQLVEELFDGSIINLLYERLFAPYAHKGLEKTNLKDLNGDEIPEYLRAFYRVVGGVNHNISPQKYSDMEVRCERFLENAVEKIVPLGPKIVGFSNTYQQTNSSIALAKALKQHLPNSIYVIGGNNCEGEMGEEIAASVEIFDYVFQGEADGAFADFCDSYLEKGILPKGKLIRCSPIDDLNTVPSPDYSDFFEQCTIPHKFISLAFESSRGCWWGYRRQCKFCGESALSAPYRSKSPERMVKDLHQLQEEYPDVGSYFATDSILPYNYFKDLLPGLAHTNFPGKLIYETKANLTYKQTVRMKKAGIYRIMPGIESLSTRLLRLLNKGTNALTNTRLLRNCRELNIEVAWLFLVGIPGDRASDYEEQLQLIPLIQHLSPPRMTPIRIQRFSPYFQDPESHGITEIEPLKSYTHAFPRSVDIARLAYYFVAKYPSESRQNPEILLPITRQLDRWAERWMGGHAPRLCIQHVEAGQWIVEDTRNCAKAFTQVLHSADYTLLKQCRQGISPKRLTSNGRVERLLDLGYLIEVDGKLLSLVCEPGIRDTEAIPAHQ
jgi:ribosomal peptide maturation radical SAM protein 1